MNRALYVLAGVAALGLIGAAALLWLPGPAPISTPSPAPAALPPAAVAPPSVASAPAEPAIKHPVLTPGSNVPSAAPPDVATLLTELFGREAVLSIFHLQDFPRRIVATVDNLGRSHAHAELWPVNPAGGRFMFARQGDADIISADNALRYVPYVLLIEKVDLQRVAAVYARRYPLLQRAYEELGYPKRYFNDRLVEVIDQLLATPEPNGPLKVRLPPINGPVQPERPWILYEFDDPALQSLSAGQKILLRMGQANNRRVKARLAEFRRLVAAQGVSR